MALRLVAKTILFGVYSPLFAVYESQNDFHNWFMLSMLHVWMVLVRLRPDTHNAMYLADALVTISYELAFCCFVTRQRNC
jgi:hypothetical protein